MMELTRVTLTDPKQGGYMYNEAIKTLRSNIQFSGKNLKVITITSCFPNEGKSDISFHLAREIGKSGKRVLLIDADIRKSVYLTRYNIQERVEGLSSFLSGQISWDRLINRTNYQNLDMIFSGPVAPNPSELLGQREFKVFLDRLKGVYDYILIDTPPVIGMIDAAVVAQVCDGAILVIESGAVSYRVAQKAKDQLEKSGCKLLGAVLNKVDTQQKRYYGGYYSRYGGYYGYGNSGKQEKEE